MSVLDIFKTDAFSVQSLTNTINEQPHVPGRIGALGYFSEEGIITTSCMIEKTGPTLSLIPSAPRGVIGHTTPKQKRGMLTFPSVHLPSNGAVLADEVQNVRAFGSESETQLVETVVARELAKMRRNMDATLEWQRIGALKGLVLDADGSTPLLDLFDAFDLSQTEIDFLLGTEGTVIKSKVLSALTAVETALGGLGFTGMRVFCGQTFWEKFIVHSKVEAAFDRWSSGDFLRQDPLAAFPYAGATWERYRGSVGGKAFIGASDAYMVPEGVADLFLTKFAPADYVEAVNTIGLPYYAKQEMMRMDKGVEIEGQSNPIMLCTRPNAVIKLTTSN
ncbi:MAG: major capsid protein [Candidatus Peribacteraceae bacterium]|nr:major capsid protein [Candidatus Peribacteraceae bacterium]